MSGLAEVNKIFPQAHGIPWTGRKQPGNYRYYPAVSEGILRHLSGRTYQNTGTGWRVLNKPVSRRKKRILERAAKA